MMVSSHPLLLALILSLCIALNFLSLTDTVFFYGYGSSNTTITRSKVYDDEIDKDERKLPSLLSGTKLLRSVHQAAFPTRMAGRWTYLPQQHTPISSAHLMCLDLERQGNCHNMTANQMSSDKAKQSRLAAIEKQAILNSPGILQANDPWTWVSDWEEYRVLPNDSYGSMLQQIVKRHKFFLIGDSLTRQWAQTMRCEFQHSLNLTAKRVDQAVRFLQAHSEFPTQIKLDKFLVNATAQDYLIFNLGHHIDPCKMGDSWREKYQQELHIALQSNFGEIPKSHIFFRTTSVRHFLRGQGDFDTNSSKAGGVAPNMEAAWGLYGGSYPVQPDQNLLALQILDATTPNLKILDVSPMMLARGDASFDGSHFCLPGPMEYWSRMLYYRIAKEQQQESNLNDKRWLKTNVTGKIID